MTAKDMTDHDNRRRDDEHRLVGEGRQPILFHHDLDHVSNHLEKAEGSDAVRPVAVLPQRQKTALEPDQQAADRQDGKKDG
jgi:hypothetical protein